MCGINGVFRFDPRTKVTPALIHAMQSITAHRGPDDCGEHFAGSVALGFSRLSIIDLSPEGHQPMCNEDGTVWVVFNGEIYNHPQLREELRGRGHRFRSRSDTETIVHAWEEFGEDCVTHLRGMFAFALWDHRREVLFLARDRVGIKPLYYHLDAQGFSFSSEMKGLLQVPWIETALNPLGISEYLLRGYTAGGNTVLQGIQKLAPGHTMTVGRSSVSVKSYWTLSAEPKNQASEPELLEQLDSLLRETIRMHLISDVPLGVFLSGGVDSSALVASMRREGVENVSTFSIGYDTPESELPLARQVAKRYDTQHHELHLTCKMFRDLIPKIAWYMDEPLADESAIPLYCLAEFAKKHITVALCGDGADEVFAGYPIYRKMLLLSRINALPGAGLGTAMAGAFPASSKLRKYMHMLGEPLERRYGGVRQLFSAADVRAFLGSSSDADVTARFYAESQGMSELDRMCQLDMKAWVPADQMLKCDRMGMAHSLELRVPFLDHKIVEFGMRLPETMKLRDGVGKYLLKKYMEPHLPAALLYSRKKGFPTPIERWMKSELTEIARENLLASDAPISAALDMTPLRKIVASSDQVHKTAKIYSLWFFNEWLRAMHANRHTGPQRYAEQVA